MLLATKQCFLIYKPHFVKLTNNITYSLVIRIHIAESKIVFFSQVQKLTNVVNKILTFGVSLQNMPNKITWQKKPHGIANAVNYVKVCALNNWISDYLQDHSHCTVYNNYSSDLRTVSASIIQGSGVGPSLYVVEASDLNTVLPQATYFANMPMILTFLFPPVTPIHD